VRAEKRQAEAARIRDKYPDRIPVSSVPWPLLALGCPWAPALAADGGRVQVIVEKAEKSDIPDIDKKKWACPPCHHSVLLLHCMAVRLWQ